MTPWSHWPAVAIDLWTPVCEDQTATKPRNLRGRLVPCSLPVRLHPVYMAAARMVLLAIHHVHVAYRFCSDGQPHGWPCFIVCVPLRPVGYNVAGQIHYAFSLHYSPGESWKYSTWHTNGVHAFGYNSAESEPIWIESGALWAHCWGLAWQILGAIRAVATVGAAAKMFLVRQIMHDFIDFPSDKFYDIWTQQRRSVRRWKHLEQNFENFTIPK